jgi:hypothetical protein
MPTFEDWVAVYKRESPFPFDPDSGFERRFIPEKGFLTFQIQPDHECLFIQEICGDMRYWMDVARAEAKKAGMKRIMGVSRRNPLAVARLLSVNFVGHIFSSEVK